MSIFGLTSDGFKIFRLLGYFLNWKQSFNLHLANLFLIWRLFQYPLTSCFKGHWIAAVGPPAAFQKPPVKKRISFLASGYLKASSFYPIGQATAAIEKSLQIKHGFARSRIQFPFQIKQITKQYKFV